MAATEARAAWQRATNRCLVQEDAKRAPKLACRSSSSSRLQSDTSGGEVANGIDQTVSNFTPFNWNSVNSNLPPDTKWWLQFQPSYAYQKESNYEWFNVPGEELEVENAIPSSKANGDLRSGASYVVVADKNASSFVESPRLVSTTFKKHGYETKSEGLKAVNNSFLQPLKRKADLAEEDELMDWKSVDQLISKKLDEDYFGLERQWVGGEKKEPWWQTADKDDLALVVAQKSLDHFENCDLPQTQKVHISMDPLASFEKSKENEKFYSAFDQSVLPGICNEVDYTQHMSNSGMTSKNQSSNCINSLASGSEKLYSTLTSTVTTKDSQERKETGSEVDPSKSKLLEALCHSQTRARKAEIAAQKAYNEKEHIVKLLFKQASYLFAYKQWLKLLQLESLCLQLKIKEKQISDFLPDLPWIPLKVDSMYGHNEGWRKGKKQRRCSICKYTLAFALGFSLASAGLLLGWSLGWMLPVFL